MLHTELPQKPASINIHRLKTNYTESEVFAIARRFGLTSFTNPDSLADNTILDKGQSDNYQMYDLPKHLYLGFNAHNGSYIFIAENGITIPQNSNSLQNNPANQDPRDVAENFMETTGMMQPCLKITDAYESTKEPGMTIVEMRCDWGHLGAPLLNTVGVLNLADNTRLNSVQLGDTGFPSTSTFDAADQEGEHGPTDFNTILIKVDSEGKIRHVGSNVLPIESSSSISASSIINPETAYKALEAGRTRLTLASPAGAGYMELDKVFPNNVAEAPEVSVNDFMLAYSIIPGIDQLYLCPKWISRSSGQLTSGYDGLFVSTMQAVNDPHCAGTDLNSSNVAGISNRLAQAVLSPTGPAPTVQTGNAGTLKLDDIVFKFEETPALGCPEASTFTNSRVLDAANGIYMMWAASQSRTWYIVFTQAEGKSLVETKSGTIHPGFRADYLAMRAKFVSQCTPRTSTSVCPLPQGLTGSIISCIRLTTGSPSIYVYSRIPQWITISAQPFGGIGYVDPAVQDLKSQNLENGVSWRALAQNSKLTFDSGTKNRAYYEFRRNTLLSQLKTYGEPHQGFVMPSSKVLGFAENFLAPHIGLNEQQTHDLVAEFQRELTVLTAESSSNESQNVQISLLPQDFVHRYLPLSLSPQPNQTFRYIFYLTSDTSATAEPLLPLIQPSDYYAVETGVLTDY